MNLSKRLETVISFVKPGSTIADVGCDHGFVAIALMERGIASRGIAMDVRPGPLSRAAEHIRRSGLEGILETRLSDGVEALLPGEADTVVVAGMGGELVIHILEGGRALWPGIGHWILSPQSELHKVRYYLEEQGFSICREEMVLEDGKYYTIMDVVHEEKAGPPLSEAEALFGPLLIQKRDLVLLELLNKEEENLGQILKGLEQQEGEGAKARRTELLKKQVLIQRVKEQWNT